MSPEEFADMEARMPDHELIVYRRSTPSELFPDGVECLIAVPKAKIEAVLAKGGPPPFWRHGEVMDIGPGGVLADAP